jgi:hypothetical protein
MKIGKIKLSKVKLVIIGIALAILTFTVAEGTIAWLTSRTETVTNTFTYGDINITLTETDTFDDDSLNTNTYEMVPGNKITKDPLITVKADSEDCYLFIKLDKTANFDTFMTYELLSNWQLLPNTENIYYQEVTKDNDKQEFYVIKGNEITVKEEVTKKMLNDLNQNGAENFPALTITAYAIQRDSEIESISTAEKAWTLISEQS